MAIKSRPPIYKLIKHDIRSSIMAARLRPGDTLPTRSEIASKYSTTQATVNKAINDLTLEGLIASQRGKRTVVLDPKRPERREIAVVWSMSDDIMAGGAEFYGPLMEGIRDACSSHKLNVVFRAADVSNYANVLAETKSSGLLVLVPNFEDLPALERLHAEGMPIVAVPGIHGSTIPDVASDHRDGIFQAVNYLADLGHADLALVSLTVALPDHFERMKWFLAAMEERGLAIRPGRLLLESRVHPSKFAGYINEWVRPERLPTAILASDFLMGMAVMRRLREAGADVPSDVSLIHFDDPAAASHMHPPTTAIAQDVPTLGRIAVEQLTRLMNGKDVEIVVRVPTNLVVRESTAPPRRRSQ